MTPKTITYNEKQYRVTFEQNAYFMVYEISASGKLYIEHDEDIRRPVIAKYRATGKPVDYFCQFAEWFADGGESIDEQIAEQQEIEEHYADFMAGTGRV